MQRCDSKCGVDAARVVAVAAHRGQGSTFFPAVPPLVNASKMAGECHKLGHSASIGA
jgi:hypothetical protein